MIRGVKILIFLLYLLFFALASLGLSLVTLIGGLLALLIPIKRWRKRMIGFLLNTPVWWTSVCNVLFYLSPAAHEWDIQEGGDLDSKKWYVLIANHQVAMDILVLGLVFNRKLPVAKFFMKKELLWSLPLLGLACWVIGYPFMRRHTHKQIQKAPELKFQDIETAKKVSQKFKLYPTTIINFVEGTRFTQAKREDQHSPCQHLLKPKAGGLALVINELSDRLSGILNVTIHYSRERVSLLNFFFGKACKVTVRYEVLPLTPALIGDYYGDRDFSRSFQHWLNHIWEQKDLLLQEMNK